MKKEQDRLLEYVNAYKMQNEKLVKTLIRKGVAMKTMAGSLVDF